MLIMRPAVLNTISGDPGHYLDLGIFKGFFITPFISNTGDVFPCQRYALFEHFCFLFIMACTVNCQGYK